MKKTAIIIGAGPAGLTAALELLEKTDIKPIVLEATSDIGGISKTVNYKGNRIDIGGHRFFSKSKIIMDYWKRVLPDDLLVRNRLSRILYGGKFYDYPVTLSVNTISNLGIRRVLLAGTSYLKTKIRSRNEKSLEDFYVNRFGEELYRAFFKDYTKKVWGVGSSQIDPSWGAQRAKGISITEVLKQAIFRNSKETSFTSEFLYPKLGPGQMWERAAKIILEKGGEVYLGEKVTKIVAKNNLVISVGTEKNIYVGDYFLSSMPVSDLILAMKGVPKNVINVAKGLVYRDFVTVGILASRLLRSVSDNWIYVQEPSVKMGRIQFFNNWSEALLKDRENFWVGTEYFGSEGDPLFRKSDIDISNLAISELCSLGFLDKKDVLDTVVIRMPKAYPAYFGTYNHFYEIREYLDNFENLFLIGRNGMHKYNNQDHSMMSAIVSVSNIINKRKDKSNIWEVNTEKEYIEKSSK